MKSIFTFFLFIIFSSLSNAQESPKELGQIFQSPEKLSLRYESDVLDSVIDWEWNVNNAVWDIEHKHKFFYDSDHYLVEYQSIFWTGSEWQLSAHHIHTYDDHHNLTKTLVQSWNGFEWVNSNQRTYYFDDDDNETYNLYETWNIDQWQNYYLTTNTYNGDNEKVTVFGQLWADTAWTNFSLDTLIYVNHELESYSSKQYIDGDGWVNFQRTLYTYENGNVIERRAQYWFEVDWVDQFSYQYTFDGNGNNTYYLQQRWISDAWTNRYQTFFDHTTFGEVYAEHGDRWINDAWDNYYEYDAQFDSRENLDIESNRYWDTTWVNSDSSKYFYMLASSIEKTNPAESGFSISPNPSSDQIFVNLDAGQEGAVSYRIYSMDGRIMETSRLNNPVSKSINVSQYAAGSYILQVKIGGQWRMKVFVKK